MVEERMKERKGKERARMETGTGNWDKYVCGHMRGPWRKRGERRGEEKWKRKGEGGCRATKSFVQEDQQTNGQPPLLPPLSPSR